MDLRGQIVQFIHESVANEDQEGHFRTPLVGFSSAHDQGYERLKELVGEHHILPEQLLPGAETVISFFIPFAEQIVKANRRQEVAEEWCRGYIDLNSLINRISEQLVAFLAAQQIKADWVRPTHTFDPVTLHAPWSHRSAAYLAGLGSFGRNRLLITPKGCAGRFGTVAMTARVTPDRPLREELCLYYQNGSCNYCFQHCPTQALGEQEQFDRHHCYEQLLAVDAQFSELDTCDVCGKCAVGPCAVLAP